MGVQAEKETAKSLDESEVGRLLRRTVFIKVFATSTKKIQYWSVVCGERNKQVAQEKTKKQ